MVGRPWRVLVAFASVKDSDRDSFAVWDNLRVSPTGLEGSDEEY